ncbi:hypothetical protein AAVH_42904, partial [Aphelenchoides avenae]
LRGIRNSGSGGFPTHSLRFCKKAERQLQRWSAHLCSKSHACQPHSWRNKFSLLLRAGQPSFQRIYLLSWRFVVRFFCTCLTRPCVEFWNWRFAIQSLMLMIFNCSFVPMMVVTLLSVYSSHILSTNRTAAYFAGIICVAGIYPSVMTQQVACLDILPTAFQVLNVLRIIPPGKPKSSTTMAYVLVCYALYAVQVAVTAVSLAVVHKQSQVQSFSGRT